MTEKLNTKQLKSVSTDVNLGNSDVLIPTQKAVKTYVDKRVFSVYEMPDAGVDYLGRALQYMGESDANYHHGYVYECVEQTEIETLILFNPVGTGRLGFDYANHNVMELFERIAAIETTFNAEDVVSGSFKLDKANELWYIDGYDANGNALFSNFTFEATGGENCLDGFGYIYTYPFPDDFEEGHEEGYTIARETHSSYSWERIDMQPNTAVWGLIAGSVLDQTDLVNYIMGQISPVDVRVTTIESYIPAQASALNQLADKSFVNSSIATNTATFRGTYNSLAELEAVTADENDYGFVVSVDAVGNTVYNRYKYTTATTPASWVFEYALNNSSFTANQWAAINSNATAEDIAKIATALQPGDNVSALTNDAGYLVMGDLTNFVTKNTAQTISGLKTFTGDIVLSGTTSIKNTTNGTTYSLLWRDASGVHAGASTQALNFAGTNTRPTYNSNNMALFSDIPTVVSALTNDSGYVTNTVNDLQYYTLSSDLATVATSGAYSDLTGLPTLGTAAAADTTDFATAAQGLLADSALQSGDNVSALVNDAGYLTTHQTLTDLGITATAIELNYVDGVTSAIQTQLDGKQATLTAGTNISISGTTISATDTTYSAGAGIDISGTTISNTGVREITTGTQQGAIQVRTGNVISSVAVYGLGTAAYTASTAYATATQGGKADTAIQPLDNVSSLTNDAGYLTAVALSGLTDVAISSLADGQSLIYDANAGKWKNVSSSVSVGFAAITGSPDDNVALKAVLDSKSGCILRRW